MDDFIKVGDRVMVYTDIFGSMGGATGTAIRVYPHSPRAMVVRFDDPNRLLAWRNNGRQRDVPEHDCHAFAVSYLTLHVDVNTSDITSVEEFLNG